MSFFPDDIRTHHAWEIYQRLLANSKRTDGFQKTAEAAFRAVDVFAATAQTEWESSVRGKEASDVGA